MEKRRHWIYFFFLLLGGTGILVFFIFRPFLIAMLIAAVLVVIFQKPYRFILKCSGNRKSISAFLTCLLVAVVIIIPFSVVLGLVVKEASTLYQNISSGTWIYQSYVEEGVRYIKGLPIVQSLNTEGLLAQKGLLDVIRGVSEWLITILKKTYENVLGVGLGVFVMFFSLFYFIMDGEQLVRRIFSLSPMKSSQEKLLLDRFVSICRATLKGTLIIGILQGTIGGIAFAIAGVPSAITWTVIMIILSVIPLMGSGLIWFPVGIFMLIAGRIWQGIVVLSVGFGIIATIDNLLRPRLVGHDIQMHPLLVFFATLGGITFFGIAGFILGPIITAFFMTLLDIYAMEFKEQLDSLDKT